MFMLYTLTCINEEFLSFLTQISFGVKYEFFGIKLNLALFYLPLLMGLLEHMFKIPDKLSSLFGIRRRYDKKVMVAEIMKSARSIVNLNELNIKQINRIMSIAFYKYASSTKLKIDTHYIYLALNEWCWYWIVLDTTILIFIVGAAVFLFLNLRWMNLIFLLAILVILFLLM